MEKQKTVDIRSWKDEYTMAEVEQVYYDKRDVY